MFFGKNVAPFIGTGYKILNTRAVPLVRKEDAHKGRVSFCLDRVGAGGCAK